MSSPPTHQKTNNSNLINKIKLSPKRFLVMVNPIYIIEIEIKKAPATAGAFSVSSTSTASKSFIDNILAVSPMIAIF